jgi:dipeptidyl aminopeptidase/acylaminoacyl peptidase
MKPAWTFVFAVATSVTFGQAPPAEWTPEFAMQFQAVSSVVPSPDGKWVAWVQTKPVMETERSEQVSQVWIGAADGSRRFQLTRAEAGASAPAWDREGKYVLFTSKRGGDTVQVYRILLQGGEAEKLTDVKGGVGGFKMAPDSKSLAFTAAEPNPDEEKAKKEKRDMHVVGANPANHSLYTAPVEPDGDGKRKQKKLFETKYDVADFEWSPDSRFIAFAHTPTPSADEWPKSDIGEVEVSTGAVKELAATEASEASPVYSPDGRYLAFTKSSIPARWAFDNRITLLNRQSGQVRELPATYDQQPNLLGWSPDSTQVLFMEPKHTRSSISMMPIDGPPTALFEPARGIANGAQLNSTGTHLGVVWESPEQAPEAFVLQAGGHTPVQVSRANADLPKLPLGKTEVVHWKSKDGLEVEGLLTYPVNYEAGKRVPLILNIHGGPTGVFSETFIGRASLYPIATFASRGYAVLRPNPRGSSGYGKTFRFANYGDWGGKDYEDDQTGVDAVIAMGVADPDRLAVMGWSYGGFMTSWTITQTKRFKAAVIGAGVTDLWSFTGTADIPGFIPDYFGGEAWDNFDAWRKHSPITYVKGVTTPTLILHGEADDRVPVTQGYEYYNALKRQGALTKMVVYPRQPHGPREPKFVLDIMQRHLDWVEKYVR